MIELGTIGAIVRYPVKSLAGERLDRADVTESGISGDRATALFVRSGHARAGKTFRGKEHNLLHTTSRIDRAAALARERGIETQVRRGSHFFDAAPISLIFDRWVHEVSEALKRPLDFMRWRPNIYAIGAPDFHLREGDLPGAVIEAGETVLRVVEPIERCVTTTYDVQTGEPDPNVLRFVARERGSTLGVYCEVELAGAVRTGDVLRLRAR